MMGEEPRISVLGEEKLLGDPDFIMHIFYFLEKAARFS